MDVLSQDGEDRMSLYEEAGLDGDQGEKCADLIDCVVDAGTKAGVRVSVQCTVAS